MRDRVLGVGVLVLAAVYIFLTYRLPVSDIGDPIGPRLFPFLIGAGLACSGVLALLGAISSTPDSKQPEKLPGESGKSGHPMVLAGVVAWMLVYFSLFDWLGFALACSIFLLGFLAFFNRGKWKQNLFIAVVFSFGINFIFSYFLGFRLATGLLSYW